MLKPFWSWTDLHSRLRVGHGMRRRRFPRQTCRRLAAEQLERRVMLTGTGLLDPLDPGGDPIVAGELSANDPSSALDAATTSQASDKAAEELPAITVRDVAATEGDDLVFTVSLSSASVELVEVQYRTAPGTTSLSTPDYVAEEGKLVFEPGETEKRVRVQTVSDETEEPAEHLWFLLSGAANAEIACEHASGLIVDNDIQPLIDISSVDVTVGGRGTFLVSLSNPYRETVTVDFAARANPGSACEGFAPAEGTLSFAPGETIRRLPVATFAVGPKSEPTDFQVVLSRPDKAQIDHGVGEARPGTPSEESPDEPLATPPAAIPPAAEGTGDGLSGGGLLAEGEGGMPDVYVFGGTASEGGWVEFEVSLSYSVDHEVSVWWETADGTANGYYDYGSVSGLLVFDPYETSLSVWIETYEDGVPEDDEYFYLVLTDVDGADIGDGTAEGLIYDMDDGAVLSVSGTSVGENADYAVFWVTLSGPVGDDVYFDYWTEGDTAQSPADYTHRTGVGFIAAGEISTQLSVPIVDDSIDEYQERFSLEIGDVWGASGVELGQNHAICYVNDNDPLPSVEIVEDVSAREDAADLTFNVVLSHESGKQVKFKYTFGESGLEHEATAGEDYDDSGAGNWVVIAPGNTTAPIAVPIVNDDTPEFDESFKVTLVDPVNCTIAGEPGIGTIENVAHTVVMDDVAGTVESQSVIIDVLANDAGDGLQLVSADPQSLKGAQLVTENGLVTYDPGSLFAFLAKDEVITDSFCYTVIDGAGVTFDGKVVVSVEGVDEAPTLVAAISDVALGIDRADVFQLDLRPYFEDLEDDDTDLSFQVETDFVAGGLDATVSVSHDRGQLDRYGVLTVDFITAANGEYGDITVRAMDTAGQSSGEDTFRVSIAATNERDPVKVYEWTGQLGAEIGVEIQRDLGVQFQLKAVPQDIDGYNEQWTFDLADSAPQGPTIDPDTGILTWTPASAGRFPITILATEVRSDGLEPLVSYTTFIVTAGTPNQPPQIPPIPDKRVQEASTLTFAVSATDPEGHNLSYSLGNSAPEGADIDASTGAFTWTPTVTQDGLHEIEVIVTDDGTPVAEASTVFLVYVREDELQSLTISDLGIVEDTGSVPNSTGNPTVTGTVNLVDDAASYSTEVEVVFEFDSNGDGTPEYYEELAEIDDSGAFTATPEIIYVPQSAVAGRHVFYKGSSYDGGNGDGAIATDKWALLPGENAIASNYTNYDKGINGVMVDIVGLPAGGGTIDPWSYGDYFQFQIYDDQNHAWTAASIPDEITVRKGEGASNSDRVTVVWADQDAIKNTWLQVTVLGNSSTGLPLPDVFYFGNMVGEVTFDNYVSQADVEALDPYVQNPLTSAGITHPYDIDRDGDVDAADRGIADGAKSTDRLHPMVAPYPALDVHVTATARSWYAPGSGVVARDVGTTVLERVALLPGGTSSDVNWITDATGITQITVDIHDIPGQVTTADFQFKVGNDNSPNAWLTLSATPDLSVTPGTEGQPDRITLTWNADQVKNEWLEVTVKANSRTGLRNDDVFYFGTAVGGFQLAELDLASYGTPATTSFVFDVADDPAPSIALGTLELVNPAGQGQAYDPTITAEVEFGGSADTVWVEIDVLGDVDEHGRPKDLAVALPTTADGGATWSFEHTPIGLPYGQATVYVRAVQEGFLGAKHGPWTDLEFELLENTPAEVTEVSLVHETAPGKTYTPEFMGHVRNPGGEVVGLVVEIDHDGDDVADGYAVTTSEADGGGFPVGVFTYRADQLAEGRVLELRARASETDPVTGDILTSIVPYSLVFDYDKSYDAPPQLGSLSLVNDTSAPGDPGGDGVTRDPTFQGTVTNVGGEVSHLRVEFDLDDDTTTVEGEAITDADGHFVFSVFDAAPGLISVRARASEWSLIDEEEGEPEQEEEKQYERQESGWSSPWTFTYDPSAYTLPEVANLELRWDTGAGSSDGVTRNPTVHGTVSNHMELAGVRVEFDYGGDSGVTDGLVGHWKLDETNGAVAEDSSGCGRDGTLAYDPAWSSDGKYGGALDFNGLNSLVSVPAPVGSPLKYVGGDMTLSTWVYVDAEETTGGYLMSKPWNGMGQYNYWLYLTDQKTVAFRLQNWAASVTSPEPLSPESWHHLAATVNSSNLMTLYVDGIEVDSDYHSITEWIPSHGDLDRSLCIGSIYPYSPGWWQGNTAYTFDGKLDDVQIFNRELSPAEVSCLAHEVGIPDDDPDGLVDGMAVVDEDGEFEFTPQIEQAGPFTIRARATGFEDWLVHREACVVERHVFYNNSTYDTTSDDDAIAPDKMALWHEDEAIRQDLEGRVTEASYFNYTNYDKGINGIMVDIADLPADVPDTIVPANFDDYFEFKVGSDSQIGTWTDAPTPQGDITVRRGAGVLGSDRVTIVWDDGAIKDKWLQVTVLGNSSTGLPLPDVFYFGNISGDTGDSLLEAQVGDADVQSLLGRIGQTAGIDSPYDFNRDGVIDASDEAIARAGAMADNALTLIEVEPMTQPVDPWVVGAWSNSEVFTLDASENVLPQVDDVSLINDTGTQGDSETTDPRLQGSVTHTDGSKALKVEIDTGDAEVTADENGQFQITPTGLGPGEHTVGLRAVEFNHLTGEDDPGAWTYFTFDVVNDPSLVVDEVTVADETAPIQDPTLVGTLSVGTDIADVWIEFDYDGDDVADDRTKATDPLEFEFAPTGLSPGTINVRARAARETEDGYLLYGAWSTSYQFVLVSNAVPSLGSIELLYDSGLVDDDRVTSDATIAGAVSNDGSLDGLLVEFSLGDQSLGSTYTDESGEFRFAPGGLPFGDLVIEAKTREYDPVTGEHLVSAPQSLGFTFVPAAAATIVYDSLAFPHANAVPPYAIPDPTITGTVTDPDGFGNVTIEIDHDGDGVADGTTRVAEDGSFRYTPSGLDFGSVQNIQVRATEIDYADPNRLVVSSWIARWLDDPDFQYPDFQFVSDGSNGPSITDVQVEERLDPKAVPTLVGQFEIPEPETPEDAPLVPRFVEVKYSGDDSGIVIMPVASAGEFSLLLDMFADSPGAKTLYFECRPVGWDPDALRFSFGDWSSQKSVAYDPAAPTVTLLELLNDDGVSGEDLATGDPTVRGIVSTARDTLVDVEFSVEYPSVNEGYVVPLGSVTADEAGAFVFTPMLPRGGDVRIRARATQIDAETGVRIVGEWTPDSESWLEFELLDTYGPTVSSVSLFNDTHPSTDDTADPTIVGNVTRSDGTTGVCTVEVEVERASGARIALGTTSTDSHGSFIFRPEGLPFGESLALRVRGVDEAWGYPAVGTWTQAAPFTLVEAAPTVTVRLLRGSDMGNPEITTDTTLTGEAAYAEINDKLLVEFDHNDDGRADAIVETDLEGSYVYTPQSVDLGETTIAVRAVAEVGGNRVVGEDWVAFQFNYTSDTFPEMESFYLRDVATGEVAGRAIMAGVGAALTVELDYTGDLNADAQVATDGQGYFAFSPPQLTAGQIVTVHARPVYWNVDEGGWTAAEQWSSLEFTFSPPGFELAEIDGAEYGLRYDTGVDGDGTTNDPTVRGQLVTPRPSAFIEFDYTGGPEADAEVAVDAAGKFAFTPVLTLAGAKTVRARIKQWDPFSGTFVYNTSQGWLSTGFTLAEGHNDPSSIQDLELANDPDGDLRTTDPAIRARLVNDGSVANTLIEIDYIDGPEPDAEVRTDAGGWLTYSPPDMVPNDNASIRVRGVEFDYLSGSRMEGDWATLNFDLDPVPDSPPTVTLFELHNDTGTSAGDTHTSDPTVEGTVHDDGEPAAGMLVEVYHNGDKISPSDLFTDAQGSFVFAPSNLPLGAVTLHARAGQLEPDGITYTFGSLVPLSLHLEQGTNSPPEVDTLSLAHDLGGGTAIDPTVAGTVTNDGNLTGLSVDIEVYCSGDLEETATVLTDAEGNFEYTPTGFSTTSNPIPVVVKALAKEWDPQSASYLAVGTWDEESFTVQANNLPVVTMQFTDTEPVGDGSTADPTVTGSVTHQDGSVAHVLIQFEFTGDEVADGQTYTDALGNFTYKPLGLEAGPIAVRARALEWNASEGCYLGDEELFAEAEAVSFTLEVDVPPVPDIEDNEALTAADEGLMVAVTKALESAGIYRGGGIDLGIGIFTPMYRGERETLDGDWLGDHLDPPFQLDATAPTEGVFTQVTGETFSSGGEHAVDGHYDLLREIVIDPGAHTVTVNINLLTTFHYVRDFGYDDPLSNAIYSHAVGLEFVEYPAIGPDSHFRFSYDVVAHYDPVTREITQLSDHCIDSSAAYVAIWDDIVTYSGDASTQHASGTMEVHAGEGDYIYTYDYDEPEQDLQFDGPTAPVHNFTLDETWELDLTTVDIGSHRTASPGVDVGGHYEATHTEFLEVSSHVPDGTYWHDQAEDPSEDLYQVAGTRNFAGLLDETHGYEEFGWYDVAYATEVQDPPSSSLSRHAGATTQASAGNAHVTFSNIVPYVLTAKPNASTAVLTCENAFVAQRADSSSAGNSTSIGTQSWDYVYQQYESHSSGEHEYIYASAENSDMVLVGGYSEQLELDGSHNRVVYRHQHAVLWQTADATSQSFGAQCESFSSLIGSQGSGRYESNTGNSQFESSSTADFHFLRQGTYTYDNGLYTFTGIASQTAGADGDTRSHARGTVVSEIGGMDETRNYCTSSHSRSSQDFTQNGYSFTFTESSSEISGQQDTVSTTKAKSLTHQWGTTVETYNGYARNSDFDTKETTYYNMLFDNSGAFAVLNGAANLSGNFDRKETTRTHIVGMEEGDLSKTTTHGGFTATANEHFGENTETYLIARDDLLNAAYTIVGDTTTLGSYDFYKSEDRTSKSRSLAVGTDGETLVGGDYSKETTTAYVRGERVNSRSESTDQGHFNGSIVTGDTAADEHRTVYVGYEGVTVHEEKLGSDTDWEEDVPPKCMKRVDGTSARVEFSHATNTLAEQVAYQIDGGGFISGSGSVRRGENTATVSGSVSTLHEERREPVKYERAIIETDDNVTSGEASTKFHDYHFGGSVILGPSGRTEIGAFVTSEVTDGALVEVTKSVTDTKPNPSAPDGVDSITEHVEQTGWKTSTYLDLSGESGTSGEGPAGEIIDAEYFSDETNITDVHTKTTTKTDFLDEEYVNEDWKVVYETHGTTTVTADSSVTSFDLKDGTLKKQPLGSLAKDEEYSYDETGSGTTTTVVDSRTTDRRDLDEHGKRVDIHTDTTDVEASSTTFTDQGTAQQKDNVASRTGDQYKYVFTDGHLTGTETTTTDIDHTKSVGNVSTTTDFHSTAVAKLDHSRSDETETDAQYTTAGGATSTTGTKWFTKTNENTTTTDTTVKNVVTQDTQQGRMLTSTENTESKGAVYDHYFFRQEAHDLAKKRDSTTYVMEIETNDFEEEPFSHGKIEYTELHPSGERTIRFEEDVTNVEFDSYTLHGDGTAGTEEIVRWTEYDSTYTEWGPEYDKYVDLIWSKEAMELGIEHGVHVSPTGGLARVTPFEGGKAFLTLDYRKTITNTHDTDFTAGHRFTDKGKNVQDGTVTQFEHERSEVVYRGSGLEDIEAYGGEGISVDAGQARCTAEIDDVYDYVYDVQNGKYGGERKDANDREEFPNSNGSWTETQTEDSTTKLHKQGSFYQFRAWDDTECAGDFFADQTITVDNDRTVHGEYNPEGRTWTETIKEVEKDNRRFNNEYNEASPYHTWYEHQHGHYKETMTVGGPQGGGPGTIEHRSNADGYNVQSKRDLFETVERDAKTHAIWVSTSASGEHSDELRVEDDIHTIIHSTQKDFGHQIETEELHNKDEIDRRIYLVNDGTPHHEYPIEVDLDAPPPTEPESGGFWDTPWSTIRDSFWDGSLRAAIGLELIDAFTPDILINVKDAKQMSWEQSGLEGTWIQTAAMVGSELTVVAASAGLGSVISAAKCGSMIGKAARAANALMTATELIDGGTSVYSGVQKFREGDVLGGIVDVTLGAISGVGAAKGLRNSVLPGCFVADTLVLVPDPQRTCTLLAGGAGLPEVPADVTLSRADLVVWSSLAAGVGIVVAEVADERRRKQAARRQREKDRLWEQIFASGGPVACRRRQGSGRHVWGEREQIFASGENLADDPHDRWADLPPGQGEGSPRAFDAIWGEESRHGLWDELPALRLAGDGRSSDRVAPIARQSGCRKAQEVPGVGVAPIACQSGCRKAQEVPGPSSGASPGFAAVNEWLSGATAVSPICRPQAAHDARRKASRLETSSRGRGRRLALAACLLVAGLLGACLWPSGHGPQTSQPYASATLAGPGGGWETGAGLSRSSGVLGVPIQEIEVGQRVLAELPEGVESERGDGDIYGEPEPAGWRRIKLRAEKVDGSFAEVELLRPISWLEGQDARVGATVDISVPECGIDGNALVLAIEQCPAIVPGPGWVVTGTFAHQSASAVDVHVEGLNGPIGTTANHPFWSEDRQEFVRADDLQPGERLRTVAGAPEVLAVIPRAPPEPVYNLEVQYAHVYHVAADGVLVHNGKSKSCKTLAKKVVGRTGKQARLRQLANDPNVSKADRGWIKQELNQIRRGKRKDIRLPGSSRKRVLNGREYGGNSGEVLAHRRGLEARKGFGYEHSDLQDVDLHKIQHKFEGYQ